MKNQKEHEVNLLVLFNSHNAPPDQGTCEFIRGVALSLALRDEEIKRLQNVMSDTTSMVCAASVRIKALEKYMRDIIRVFS